MKKGLSLYSLLSLMFLCCLLSFQGCSKKQVKKDQEASGGAAGLGKGKTVDVVEIGHSGLMQTVYFEFDKFSLSEEARTVLKENAQWLKSKKNIKVQVEGHCDSRGTEEYNLALGQKRADSVRKYLILSCINYRLPGKILPG